MSRAEIRRKFDEIIAFAELEKFLDTPVKYYSSGMYMRLAFAVAAHLEPEILLVDEVLAVGDAAFQKKCLGKMGDVAKQGRTVLFVSHNLAAVQSLCGRVIHLQQGRLVEDGSPAKVISNYLSTSFSTQTEQRWPDITTAPGTEAVRLHLARVRPVDGSCRDAIDVTTPFLLEFEFWNLTPGAYLDLSVVLYNEEGIPVFNTMPLYETEWHERPFPFGLFRSVCYIPGDLLNNGIHTVELYVVKDQTVDLYCHSDLLVFEVGRGIERRKFWHNDWLGATRPKLEWRTELLQADLPANSN
jgi:lipopolysaccharide transport system ATP-binding protein